MRTRKNQIVFFLNDKEYKHFNNQLKVSGLTKSEYIRKLIMKEKIKERPPQNYAQIVYELSKIGNNINQLAYKANKTNYAAVEDAQTAVLLMERCWDLVKGME